MNDLDLAHAESSVQIAAVRGLFLEYAQSLGFSLRFQSFDQELASLPGDYAPPTGRLILASQGVHTAGCVALHAINNQHCEMKRLYVRPQFRGHGLGKILTERIIAEARQIGYTRLRLDTVEPKMKTAVAMYRRLGFSRNRALSPEPDRRRTLYGTRTLNAPAHPIVFECSSLTAHC